MTNGYGQAIRIFTEGSKIPFSHLRSKGFLSVVSVDDSYLQSNTNEACLHNIESTERITEFKIHYTSYEIYFFSNAKNSLSWIRHLLCSNYLINNSREKEQIYNLCLETFQEEKIMLRTQGSVICNFTASFLAVSFGLFF